MSIKKMSKKEIISSIKDIRKAIEHPTFKLLKKEFLVLENRLIKELVNR